MKGWTGTIEQPDSVCEGGAEYGRGLSRTGVHAGGCCQRANLAAAAEAIFARHNGDDRLCPSMSVGDVIVIGEAAVSVDSLAGAGFSLGRPT